MGNNFEEAFKKVIDLEGGFTLHKNQTESEVTYAGIYKKAHPNWRGWEYIDKKETPPTSLVRTFYYENYYKQFEDLPNAIAYVLFESSVNMGSTAIRLAQSVANVVSDGVFGPKTKEALQNVDEELFIAKFTLAKIAYYNTLAKRDRYRPYLRGWINRALSSVKEI